MATFIKELIPPLIYRKLTQKRNRKTLLYNSYDEAMIECTKEAYENEELIKVIFEKTKIYKTLLDKQKILSYDCRISSMIAGVLMAKNNGIVNVLDFGGACGTHYFEVRKGLPSSIKLNWIVVETPMMISYGKQFSSDELSFESDLFNAAETLGTVNFIYSSGTIQFVDKPFVYLEKLISTGADYMMFNRLGLTLGNRNLIFVHQNRLSWNGVGPLPSGYSDKWIRYPYQLIKKSQFEQVMNKQYKTIFDYADDSGIIPVNNEIIEGKGILFQRIIRPTLSRRDLELKNKLASKSMVN